MRYNEWMDKISTQQKRLKDLALSEVSESIFVGGKGVTIVLGKGKYETYVGETNVGIRFLRTLYTKNKEEFDAMLDSITQATNEVASATELILTTISAEAVPQAVIARMKGEQTSGDPADLVEAMTESKLRELLKVVSGALGRVGVFQSFEGVLAPVGERNPQIHFTSESFFEIGWGRTKILRRHQTISATIPDVEEALFFLANYDLIKERFLQFTEKINAIK